MSPRHMWLLEIKSTREMQAAGVGHLIRLSSIVHNVNKTNSWACSEATAGPVSQDRQLWVRIPGTQACPTASQQGGLRGKQEDNRDKSKFIHRAVTPNDIFTDFFNSSFDNVLSALFIFLKDESWLRVSSARWCRESVEINTHPERERSRRREIDRNTLTGVNANR